MKVWVLSNDRPVAVVSSQETAEQFYKMNPKNDYTMFILDDLSLTDMEHAPTPRSTPSDSSSAIKDLEQYAQRLKNNNESLQELAKRLMQSKLFQKRR